MLGRAQCLQYRSLGVSSERNLQLQHDDRCAHVLGVGRNQEQILEGPRPAGACMSRELTRTLAAAIASVGVVGAMHAHAQSPSRPPDAGRGAVIAAQGVAPRVPACAQCHAFDGASEGSGAFPRIAGQSTYYLGKQMRDFASGVRTDAVMTPIGKALSTEEVADVAAYYATVASPFLPLKSGDPTLVKRGEQLARIGD